MRKAVPPPTMWDIVLEVVGKWAWAADKSETGWSSIEEFNTSGRRGHPGFSDSKEINATRVSEIRNSCEFERRERM